MRPQIVWRTQRVYRLSLAQLHTLDALREEQRHRRLRSTVPGLGLSVQITEMRALPAREGWSMRVSLELRKGSWSILFYAAFEARVPMMVPRVSRLV